MFYFCLHAPVFAKDIDANGNFFSLYSVRQS